MMSSRRRLTMMVQTVVMSCKWLCRVGLVEASLCGLDSMVSSDDDALVAN